MCLAVLLPGRLPGVTHLWCSVATIRGFSDVPE
eukprot:CAMPEP_0183445004 /NCGR_PEP_ID=MMETSP0370-20130417/96053_1 /TAXON_ID=268820 /ORGANISM="Peridinium aciculiferum, Strain PAER-2" /LENGTH=32 /DNA_ID= /DNA_START= /DNA_END= /DNA_ORIENTATION=